MDQLAELLAVIRVGADAEVNGDGEAVPGLPGAVQDREVVGAENRGWRGVARDMRRGARSGMGRTARGVDGARRRGFGHGDRHGITLPQGTRLNSNGSSPNVNVETAWHLAPKLRTESISQLSVSWPDLRRSTKNRARGGPQRQHLPGGQRGGAIVEHAMVGDGAFPIGRAVGEPPHHGPADPSPEVDDDGQLLNAELNGGIVGEQHGVAVGSVDFAGGCRGIDTSRFLRGSSHNHRNNRVEYHAFENGARLRKKKALATLFPCSRDAIQISPSLLMASSPDTWRLPSGKLARRAVVLVVRQEALQFRRLVREDCRGGVRDDQVEGTEVAVHRTVLSSAKIGRFGDFIED